MNSFWINVYESELMFSKKKSRWATGNHFESKELAKICSNTGPNDGIKYIGAYKITLKQK